jgi:glycolate oxidase iron-sulfur subunit
MDSPRGRVYLMQMARDGSAAMTQEWVSHFDTCLGCMACMPACPSGVEYGKLLEATRAQIARRYKRSAAETWFRRVLFDVLPDPAALRMLRWPMVMYQRFGARRFLQATGLSRLLPAHLRSMEALMPNATATERVPAVSSPAGGPARQRVGMLLGCIQREFLSPVNAATARVLAAEGFEVVAPADQPCCGALLTHAGEEARAQAHARRMIDVFDKAGVDVIATNAAGCGSAMKEYGYLLRDDPNYAERAETFAAKCKDVTEILAADAPRAARKPVGIRVAYHDACHLQHAQGVRAQPRRLLSQIPGLELLEIPEPGICCGSAGIYNLVQPETATALGDRKAQQIAPLDPDVIATGNPGCLLQIQAALTRIGRSIPVVHTMQILDASITGRDGGFRK